MSVLKVKATERVMQSVHRLSQTNDDWEIVMEWLGQCAEEQSKSNDLQPELTLLRQGQGVSQVLRELLGLPELAKDTIRRLS